MKKLIMLISLFTISLFNITTVKAENISFDDATFINYYSNHFGYEMNANLSEFGNALVTWSIPNFNDLIYTTGGIDSAIIFYSKANQTGFIEEVTVFDLEPSGPYPNNLSGTYQFNLLDYGFSQEEIESIRSIKVRIMVSHFVPPSGFGPALASNMIVSTGPLSKVTFVHEGDLWFETLYVGTINEPPTNPTTVDSVAFEGWYDLEGNVLNEFRTYQGDQVFNSRALNLISILYYAENQLIGFETVTRNQELQLTLPTNPIVSGLEFLWWEFQDGTIVDTLEFYSFNQQEIINAVFRIDPTAITAPGIGIVEINPLTTILSGFGLNNQFGYLFFMLLVFVPLNLFFAFLALPVIAIAISNFTLIALFIYLNFIPFWFSFIIVAFIILAIIAMAKGVIRLE